MLEEERDPWLGPDRSELAIVGIDRSSLGVAIPGGFGGAEFLDDLADMRKRLLAGVAFGPDPHLAAAVATEHRSILDQGHGQPIAGRRQGCRRARHAAPDHHEIELASILRLLLEPEQLSAPLGHLRA